jgi:hypothetical protein
MVASIANSLNPQAQPKGTEGHLLQAGASPAALCGVTCFFSAVEAQGNSQGALRV